MFTQINLLREMMMGTVFKVRMLSKCKGYKEESSEIPNKIPYIREGLSDVDNMRNERESARKR